MNHLIEIMLKCFTIRNKDIICVSKCKQQRRGKLLKTTLFQLLIIICIGLFQLFSFKGFQFIIRIPFAWSCIFYFRFPIGNTSPYCAINMANAFFFESIDRWWHIKVRFQVTSHRFVNSVFTFSKLIQK